MPYIHCPDGRTYSRYSQTEYVKWCICNEREQSEKKFNECMQDPNCKKQHIDKQNIMIFGGFLTAILIGFTFWILLKRHN